MDSGSPTDRVGVTCAPGNPSSPRVEWTITVQGNQGPKGVRCSAGGELGITTLRNLCLSLVGATILAGCSSNESMTQADLEGLCPWPAAANSYDAGVGGCVPRPKFDICEVPNGGTVLADGGILGPDGSVVLGACKDACSPTEYALDCFASGPDDAGQFFGGTPDSSLACIGIPVPTPIGVSFYCCPCGS